jgi:hypothetical protein
MISVLVPCARAECPNWFERTRITHNYCSETCRRYKPDTGPVKPSINKSRETEFVMVDGEGIGNGRDHKYVLLGVGDRQREWPDGVKNIIEIFDFLYATFTEKPDAVYAGFFLGYDFNMWLRLLPRERAWLLLSAEGKAKRARNTRSHLAPFPVEFCGYEFDILGMKRFKLKPKAESKWMYICDAGPFFQTSFLIAIDPRNWNKPVVTAEEYAAIKQGKERRDSAVLDDEMRYYNRLENEVGARLMKRLELGLSHANVSLKKQQWFGPGQAAQAWMRLNNKLDRTTKAIRSHKSHLINAAIATYYGGWFELPVHGHIPGLTYEYDINSAYPFIASQLPCLCGKWEHGTRSPKNGLSMVRVIVWGKDRYLGPLPYRREDGRVLRPRYTEGWYWWHEILAAKRAGLISEITCLEYYTYSGCPHPPPLKQLNGLYESRLRIGKDTPEGKAFKILYNSVYGKLAQSEGEPVFGNPFYASLITAGCRVMVLEAITTHPLRSSAVVMVATDGIYFTAPHPQLDSRVSQKMGEWSKSIHSNLCVFKPGIYWDDDARTAIARGEKPAFKSRGISAADFAESIAEVDKLFNQWGEKWLPGMPPGRDDWPCVSFKARFTQTSVRQALQWTEEIEPIPKKIAIYKNLAGAVHENKTLVQDSWPGVKRNPQRIYYDGRLWRSQPWDGGPHWSPSTPYNKRFGMVDDTEGFSQLVTPDGPAIMIFRQALGTG